MPSDKISLFSVIYLPVSIEKLFLFRITKLRVIYHNL